MTLPTYYVLHRDSFGMAEAPIGACILYALFLWIIVRVALVSILQSLAAAEIANTLHCEIFRSPAIFRVFQHNLPQADIGT